MWVEQELLKLVLKIDINDVIGVSKVNLKSDHETVLSKCGFTNVILYKYKKSLDNINL